MLRCSFEKPSSLERFLRTRSPSRIVTGRPPSSSSFESRTFAIVLLPEPLRPVKKTVKPCRARAGWLRRSSFTTLVYENQLGISVPRARRSRSSVPLMSMRLLVFGHFVDGVVLVFVGDVDHLLEVDHLHAELFFVLLEELLGIVRAVERLAALVLAGAGVVAADDEVRAAVVLADDGVPDRFARAAHSHREREQREHGRVLRIVRHQRLVAADARVVVDVARLGHADDRVDEQVRAFFLRGAERELVVCAVHRVAGLEGDDLRPAALAELFAEFLRRVAERSCSRSGAGAAGTRRVPPM